MVHHGRTSMPVEFQPIAPGIMHGAISAAVLEKLAQHSQRRQQRVTLEALSPME